MGSIGSAAANIVKTVKEAKNAKKQLMESKRHNEKMEAIALGKGLVLKRHKKGFGLFLNPPKNF